MFRNARNVQQKVDRLRDQVFTELDEHREAINSDTQELNLQSTRIDDIENKIDVLLSRLDKLEQQYTCETKHTAPLTLEEQQVFLTLYTHDDPQGLPLRNIALRSGVDLHSLSALLESMKYKEIPVEKHIVSGEVYVGLETSFKERQAKYGIVAVSEFAVSRTQAKSHVTLDRFGE